MSRYLIDKSALARAHREPVTDSLLPLFDRGRVVTCAMVDLELLFSARSPSHYEQMWDRQRGLLRLPVTEEICERALDVQRTLARTSRHRGAAIPDLVIAACAELNGATLLHYDADFDLVAEVTGQASEWVVPRGSVD